MLPLRATNLKIYQLSSAEIAQLIERLTSILRNQVRIPTQLFNLIFWASKQFLKLARFVQHYVLKLDRFEEELVLFSCRTFRNCLRFETRPF